MSALKTAVQTPELVPQSHGGALYRSGVPGNRGGGRIPDATRRLMEENLEAAIPVLHARFKRGKLDAIGYFRALAEYVWEKPKQRVEVAITNDQVARAFAEMGEAAREVFGEEQAERLRSATVERLKRLAA